MMQHGGRLLVSMGVSGVNHIIGYIFMMQIVSSIFDFDSDSWAHFRSETLQRFIYFNNIKQFVLVEGDY